jgi:hypothetical protein
MQTGQAKRSSQKSSPRDPGRTSFQSSFKVKGGGK